MHEHALQSSIGVSAVTELTFSILDRIPPRSGELSNSLVLSQGCPAMVDMQNEGPTGTHKSEKGIEHGSSIGSAVDHPHRAEQADGMIHALFGKAAQFDEVCLNGKDCASGATGPEFAIHDFEHGTTQVDPNHVIATFCQWQSGSAAAAAEVDN
jgi:hypothetical protein